MVADAVEGFVAEVERDECCVRTPYRVVIALLHVRAQRILARVAAGPVPTVMAERDCFRKRNVQSECARNRDGNLRHFERVREACALVVIGEHEYLGLAGEAAERTRVEDSVTVTLEAGAVRVRLFLSRTVARADTARGERGKEITLSRFLFFAVQKFIGARARPRIGMSETHPGLGVRVRTHG